MTRYLPGFTACQARPVTLWRLLTHTAGLPDTRKFYEWCGTREELLRELAATPLARRQGPRSPTPTWASSRSARSSPRWPASRSTAPSGGWSPSRSGWPHRVHPHGPAGPLRRHRAPRGRHLLDRDRARRERAADGRGRGARGPVLDRGRPGRVRRLVGRRRRRPGPGRAAPGRGDRQTAGPRRPPRAGWVCAGDRFDILGGHWPPPAVSHTGFTGTSLALDPPSGVWVVLLTNAVHFGRDATAVKALRRAVHERSINRAITALTLDAFPTLATGSARGRLDRLLQSVSLRACRTPSRLLGLGETVSR